MHQYAQSQAAIASKEAEVKAIQTKLYDLQ